MDIGTIVLIIAALVIGGVIGGVALNYYQSSQGKNRRTQAEDEARNILNQAKQQSQASLIDAEEKSKAILKETEETTVRRRRELDKEDERLRARREDLKFTIALFTHRSFGF